MEDVFGWSSLTNKKPQKNYLAVLFPYKSGHKVFSQDWELSVKLLLDRIISHCTSELLDLLQLFYETGSNEPDPLCSLPIKEGYNVYIIEL